MTPERFSRTEMLLGTEGFNKIAAARVAIFGVGGVGGHAAEALARSGVGTLVLFDKDTVSESNINRQIIATSSTVGRQKTDVMAERIRDINPEAKVVCHNVFYSSENADAYDLSQFDYVIDAIDTVKSKLLLIERATKLGVPIISSMGAGNKLDPTRFEVSDIKKTSVCPLAKVIRTELRKRGIEHLKVVYSKEEPKKCVVTDGSVRHAPGSIAFVPSVVGLIIAGEVIKDISGIS